MSTDCIFCKIANNEIPSDYLVETDNLVAFNDINPQAPVHILIVPKKHIRSINDLETPDSQILGEMIFIAKELAQEKDINKSGYKLQFNVEKGGGQEVFHLHMHLTGGW